MRTTHRTHRSAWPLRLLIGAIVVVIVAMTATPGSAQEAPNPIVPKSGEANLLDVINSLPLNDIDKALDNFPVPYVVVAKAGDGAPVIANNRAGAPTRVDADNSKTTGQGGNDIVVEVITELTPTPHLELEVERLGSAPYVSDLTVLIAFPFDAFNDEVLPGAPNLFVGYQTTANDGSAGGIAPVSEVITFTPETLAGTTHTFTLGAETTGAANPLRYLAGHFDGDNVTGILNADAMSAWVNPVPSWIDLTLAVDESAISPGPGGTSSLFDLGWAASAPANVVFDYLENELYADGASDYNTTLTVNQMPTNEQLSVGLDEAAGTLTLSHNASAVIDEITLLHERGDGLSITATATDVPTMVDVTMGLSGSAALNVNANTLDLSVIATQQGGFAGTEDFLGYRLGYLALNIVDAPDLEANYDAMSDTYSIAATNAGESIPLAELIIGDDDQLELSSDWSDTGRHIFSLVDDGTHGTAAARVLHTTAASLSLDATEIGQAYVLTTGQAAPLTGYLRTYETSNLIPNHDIEATCTITDVPQGTLDFAVDYPANFSYTTNPPTEIESVHCAGHLDDMHFDVELGDLPPVFAFEFDPDGSMSVLAEDGFGGPDTVGVIGVRLWTPSLTGLPGSGALMGIPLNDARLRADVIPSFHATWSDTAGATTIDFDTDANDAFVAGVQLGVSTQVEFFLPFTVASADSSDYLYFIDDGGANRKRISIGAFGIDAFTYDSNDTQLAVHYDADSARRLAIEIATTFGGRFFPTMDIEASLKVDAIPQLFDLSTDLDTFVDYSASSGITSIDLTAHIDQTELVPNDVVHVNALVTGLPAQANIDMDATDGHAHLHASGAVESILVELSSQAAIFGSDYRWFRSEVTSVPANLDIDWTAGGTSSIAVVLTDVNGDPAPLGMAEVTLSRETKIASGDNLDPFMNIDGGMVLRSAFLDVIDDRYFPGSVESRLDTLYTTNISLDGTPLEDHVIIRQPGTLDFVKVQFSGFQSLTATASSSTLVATVNIPTDGTHPLFVGYEGTGGNFTLVQIEDIPDTMTVDVNANDHAYFDASGSPGQIDIYNGPLPMAGEGVDALRATLLSTPSSVHLNFGDLDSFPGGASFQASNQFELLLLTQDDTSRVVLGLEMEDVYLSYGAEAFYDGCDEVAGVDTCLGLFKIEGALSTIGSSSGEGISGFFMQYDLVNPEPLVGSDAVDAVGKEYVPRISMLLGDFQYFSASLEIQLDPAQPFGELFPIDLELDITGPEFGVGFVFDFWDLGFEACFGETCIVDNPPDYIDNNPWHIVPLFHGGDAHFDPYA